MGTTGNRHLKRILFIKCIICIWFYPTFIKRMRLTNICITRTLGRAIIEVSKFMQSSRSKWQSKFSSKKAMKSYSSTLLVVSTRELSGYVANDGRSFITLTSCFSRKGWAPPNYACLHVMTILLFSLSRVSCYSNTGCQTFL